MRRGLLLRPVLPTARPVERTRTTDLRAVLNAIFYLLRTGCQWRLLAREFPPCGTVYHYFQAWQNSGVCGFIYIAVDTLGLLVANRVETADTSDRRAGALLLGGSCGLFPRIPDDHSRCRPRKPQARSNPAATPRMAATDRQETTTSVQDHGSDLDR
jgi:hypothetical protein